MNVFIGLSENNIRDVSAFESNEASNNDGSVLSLSDMSALKSHTEQVRIYFALAASNLLVATMVPILLPSVGLICCAFAVQGGGKLILNSQPVLLEYGRI